MLTHPRQHYRNRHLRIRFPSWLISLLRTARGLMYYRDHVALCQLDVYRNYIMRASNDVAFQHLENENHLVQGLTTRERVRRVLSHYRFEDGTYGSAYKNAVYRNGGLQLWEQRISGNVFSIRLEMAQHINVEGALAITLVADGNVLHRLSFSWIEGVIVGVSAPLVPFIVHNRGSWFDSSEAFTVFERCFPNNLPGFFCFAALQGIVERVGMNQVIAVPRSAQTAYSSLDGKGFGNAYDGFWETLGGAKLLNGTWLIGLPFYLKPMCEIPSKRRKRTAQRRDCWRMIEHSARTTLGRYLLHTQPCNDGAVESHEIMEV